jgi:hypothetical protein
MPDLSLTTACDVLRFEPETGRLASMRTLTNPEVELLSPPDDLPAFALNLLTSAGETVYADSRQCGPPEMRLECDEAGGAIALSMAFSRVDGLDLDVTLRVAASLRDRFLRWSAEVRNGTGMDMVDLQFPFVVCASRPDLSVLDPSAFGSLLRGPALEGLPQDAHELWRLSVANGSSPHYPGRSFAQFMAAYAQGAGIYLACDDAEANVKLFRPVRSGQGVRLGIAHIGDWPAGARTLEYQVLLGSFEGDWYDAAELYRGWALQQEWATPLTARTDVPEWLLDSPPHITIRLQGYVDDGVAPPIEAFLPYEKCIPLLDAVATRVDAPLVAVLMSWERGGPWVYPDCFPPIGGDESMARFAAMARERGWHVGSFCNGTRWVTRHLFNGYEGEAFFRENGGERSVSRQSDGSLWPESWDQGWRPSYVQCMDNDMTRHIATEFVERLVGWGMESIQFFDQNCNAATFPCFATDHGHPRIPGKWMARAMRRMMREFRQVDARAGEAGVIHSTEMPCNETCLPLFQQSDVRVSPPTSGLADFVPVYQYLYHECAILHGMMSFGPEPVSMAVRSAWNLVLGEITGGVLTGDGTLLNRDTINWAEWEPKVGSDEDSLEMMRTVTALRRGAARPFLVYGRMQRPADMQGIEVRRWERPGRKHELPVVAHSAWTDPEGRHGVVLANWTNEPQTVRLTDPRLPKGAVVTAVGRETTQAPLPPATGEVTIPALGCVLVASGVHH